MLVASEAQIYRLRPTPIDEQIGAYLRAVQVLLPFSRLSIIYMSAQLYWMLIRRSQAL